MLKKEHVSNILLPLSF